MTRVSPVVAGLNVGIAHLVHRPPALGMSVDIGPVDP